MIKGARVSAASGSDRPFVGHKDETMVVSPAELRKAPFEMGRIAD